MQTIHKFHQFWAVCTLAAAFTFSAIPVQADSVGADPALASLDALIAAPAGPLPAGTKVQSVSIADGLATVNFSPQLKDNFHGGDTDEADAVNGILRVLGRFPAVSRVQILVGGRPVESLGGMLVISGPLAVIRPAGYAEAHRMYLHRRTPARR